MIPSLTQETIQQYASDAQTIQEPTGTDYTQGAKVGNTIPAKWWNWLFNAFTKRIGQSRSDADSMLTELKNAVTDAGLTPSASDSTQLAQAVANKSRAQINTYIERGKSLAGTWHNIPSDVHFDGIIHEVLNAPTPMYYYYDNTSVISDAIYIGSDFEHMHRVQFKRPPSTPLYPNTTVNIDWQTTNIAIVFFNSTFITMIQDNLADCLQVFSSLDCVTWTYVTSVPMTEDTMTGTLAVFLLGTSIFVLRGPNRDAQNSSFSRYRCDLAYTDDGVTWHTRLYYNATSTFPIWSYSYRNFNTLFRPIRIGDTTKYVIGSNIFDISGGDITSLDGMASMYGAACFNSPMVQLFNGNILIGLLDGNSNVLGSGQVTKGCYLVDTAGNATNISNYGLNYAYSKACGDVAILQTVGSPTPFIPGNGYACTAFTKDGVNIYNFPSQFMTPYGLKTLDVQAAFKLNGTYYVSTNYVYISGVGYCSYLFSATELSSSYSDYTLVSSRVNRDYAKVAGPYPLGVGNVLATRDGKFSVDFGLTWHDTINLDTGMTQICPSVGTQINNTYLGNGLIQAYNGNNSAKAVWFTTTQANVQTANVINHVFGHTLYLQ